ncbi:hypothetical protein SCP_0502010 [Sparassis crispa]|uniref:Uncharacterized protein n=1 Tax=Sparassis crispa TaxID=139825 RepID=A0A401GN17_9APHY|nr:hypothetical protein SCP_0501860 [Sparassis crispa]XP_027614057.1 hypothetical protein SCP_0501910 [Sparassis crispa]XP_027614067.1 hypothetical protein SCP_0502010 [Sparassis crispa]GBE83139.1 hypothetical protein SCP_0501860 [Sparassis crispa]GBE83144.1 hypothetical protein SCP_0501910 [Sparassis crispa]GBE83154.1 hypothetical protein SCP_0502010 [Sparassis crispa]
MPARFVILTEHQPILSEKLRSYDTADAKGCKTLVQSLRQKLKTQFVDTSNYDDIIVETKIREWLNNHARHAQEKATKKRMHVSGKPNAFKVWDALERDKVTEAARALMAEKGCNVSKVWRVARSAEWAKLSEEEQKVYEEKAESWRNGTLDDKTKMKLREQRMMQYLKKFAKTMWDTMGIRMAFMLAYPKEAGSLKVEMVEVNHAITNGTPFGVYPGWLRAYQPLAKVFSEWAKGEYAVTETMVTVKKTPADCMQAMDKIWLTANGFPLLPSVPEALAKGVWNCKSPWTKLNSIDDINEFIPAEMLPENFQWIDPSKLTSVPVCALLDHWRACQEEHGPEQTMRFTQYFDKDGEAAPAKYDPLPPLDGSAQALEEGSEHEVQEALTPKKAGKAKKKGKPVRKVTGKAALKATKGKAAPGGAKGGGRKRKTKDAYDSEDDARSSQDSDQSSPDIPSMASEEDTASDEDSGDGESVIANKAKGKAVATTNGRKANNGGAPQASGSGGAKMKAKRGLQDLPLGELHRFDTEETDEAWSELEPSTKELRLMLQGRAPRLTGGSTVGSTVPHLIKRRDVFLATLSVKTRYQDMLKQVKIATVPQVYHFARYDPIPWSEWSYSQCYLPPSFHAVDNFDIVKNWLGDKPWLTKYWFLHPQGVQQSALVIGMVLRDLTRSQFIEEGEPTNLPDYVVNSAISLDAVEQLLHCYEIITLDRVEGNVTHAMVKPVSKPAIPGAPQGGDGLGGQEEQEGDASARTHDGTATTAKVHKAHQPAPMADNPIIPSGGDEGPHQETGGGASDDGKENDAHLSVPSSGAERLPLPPFIPKTRKVSAMEGRPSGQAKALQGSQRQAMDELPAKNTRSQHPLGAVKDLKKLPDPKQKCQPACPEPDGEDSSGEDNLPPWKRGHGTWDELVVA